MLGEVFIRKELEQVDHILIVSESRTIKMADLIGIFGSNRNTGIEFLRVCD